MQSARSLYEALCILCERCYRRWTGKLSSKSGNGSFDKMKKTNRPINKIFIHCSATPPKMDIGADEIRKWHKKRGWSDIGYHYVIRRNGAFELGRDIDLIGAHVKGHNTGSIGVCMVGGVDDNNAAQDNFTGEQWSELITALKVLKKHYPQATIHGHNEFAAKACPSFDVQKELTNGRLRIDD